MSKKLIISLFMGALAPSLAMSAAYPVQSVRAVSDGEVEYLLASSTGLTLYTFANDPINATPVCDGKCAEIWPPVLLSDEEADAVEAPYSVVLRTSGLKQLARDGKALYTYFLDRKAGHAFGDGIGGVWSDIHLDVSVAGCTLDKFVLNASAQVAITTAGASYSPKCLQVKKGTTLTLPASSMHPIKAMNDVLGFSNPITTFGEKTSPITIQMNQTGIFGYFCTNHGSISGQGMAAAIEVID